MRFLLTAKNETLKILSGGLNSLSTFYLHIFTDIGRNVSGITSRLQYVDLSLRTQQLIIRLYATPFWGVIILPSGEVMLGHGQRIGSNGDRKAPSSRSTRSMCLLSQQPGHPAKRPTPPRRFLADAVVTGNR